MINMTKEEIKEFLKIARSQVSRKTKFRHRGRNENGLDCAGLVLFCLHKLDKEFVDLKVYGREPYNDGLKKVVEKNMGDPILFDNSSDKFLMPGDILLMSFVNEPGHVCIVGDYAHGGLSLIHCYSEVGNCVEHRLDKTWLNRVKYAYRFSEK